MNGWGLLSLAAALVLAPAPSTARGRLSALERSGRLPERARRPHALSWSRRPRSVRPHAVGATLVASVVIGRWVGVPLGVAGGVAAGTLGALFAAGLARRRRVARRRGTVTAVRLLAAELQAGAQPADALAGCASASPEHGDAFAAAAAAARSGADVPGALLAAGDDLRALAHAWRVVEVAGTPLVDVLNRLVRDLGAAQDQHRAVSVALAGPRSSAVLLAALPVLGVGLGSSLGAAPGEVLLGSQAGQLLCCAGVLLDAAGVAWTQWLTRGADPA
jgi:tight adherence protein B